MQMLKTLFNQLMGVWNRLPVNRRIGLSAALFAGAIAIFSIVYWATSPEYVVLANQLSPTQSAEIVAALDAEKIAYQLNYSGSAVSVPRSHLTQARLAAGELIDPEDSLEAIASEQSPWDPPALQADRILRQQELRLGRSIVRMRGVRSAVVHIGRSDPSPFLRDSRPTTASVILDLQPGWQLGEQQATSIVSLVSHGVEGLTQDNVTVLDTEGRILSNGAIGQADVSRQLDYKNRLEQDLVAKAETMLEQMLGPGRATVRVSADIDFTDIKRTETRYDPESKAKKNETITTISQVGNGRKIGGPPGVDANLSEESASAKSDNYKEEHTTVDFENAKIDETTHELPGKVQRLTVAAIVELPKPPEGEAATAAAVPGITDVEAIIKQAVGFDEQRLDKIQVVVAPMESTNLIEQDLLAASNWERYAAIAQNASLGLGAIAALVITVLILRRLQPIVVESRQPDQLNVEQLQHLLKMANFTRENSSVAAQVMKSLMKQEPAEAEETETIKFRKAG